MSSINRDCVSVDHGKAGRIECLGDYLKRSQLALFLDYWLNIPIMVTSHNFKIGLLFGRFVPAKLGCTINGRDFHIQSCAMGKCECYFEWVLPLSCDVLKHCETIRVIRRTYLIS